MEDKVEKIIEYIPGGLANGLTPDDIAEKHGVEVSVINEQLKMGIEVEHEHSPDDKVAAEIAKDHLTETPFYYSYLEKMEEEFKENLKEDLERGGMEDEEEEEKKGKEATEDDAVEFLKENPNPSDDDLHEHCEENGIKVSSLEAQMYKLATKYVKSISKNGFKSGKDSLMGKKEILKRLFGV